MNPLEVLRQLLNGPSEPSFSDLRKKRLLKQISTGNKRLSPVGGFLEGSDDLGVSSDLEDAEASTDLSGGYSVYRPEVFNDPSVISHERIHQSQSKLKNPNIKILKKLLDANTKNLQLPEASMEKHEYPAYAFSDDAASENQVQALFNYLNYLKFHNAGDQGIAGVETSVPQTLYERLIKSRGFNPRPPVPPGLK